MQRSACVCACVGVSVGTVSSLQSVGYTQSLHKDRGGFPGYRPYGLIRCGVTLHADDGADDGTDQLEWPGPR